MGVMPRDRMWVGPRPAGPRPAWEFDELFACFELDAEDKENEEMGGGADGRPGGPPPDVPPGIEGVTDT